MSVVHIIVLYVMRLGGLSPRDVMLTGIFLSLKSQLENYRVTFQNYPQMNVIRPALLTVSYFMFLELGLNSESF